MLKCYLYALVLFNKGKGGEVYVEQLVMHVIYVWMDMSMYIHEMLCVLFVCMHVLHVHMCVKNVNTKMIILHFQYVYIICECVSFSFFFPFFLIYMFVYNLTHLKTATF